MIPKSCLICNRLFKYNPVSYVDTNNRKRVLHSRAINCNHSRNSSLKKISYLFSGSDFVGYQLTLKTNNKLKFNSTIVVRYIIDKCIQIEYKQISPGLYRMFDMFQSIPYDNSFDVSKIKDPSYIDNLRDMFLKKIEIYNLLR